MIFSSTNPPTGFYHYLYLREDGTPYYSGKGKGNRAWIKHKSEVRPPKDKSRIIITHWGLTELWAFALERWHIRWYGRKDISTGILRNGTDGGEGATGSRGKSLPKSASHRKNLSIAKKGKKYPNISASLKGKTRKPNSGPRSDIGKPRPQPKLCCIVCKIQIGLNALVRHQNSKKCRIKIPKVVVEKVKVEPKTKVMPSKSSHYRYDATLFLFAHKDGTIEKMPANDFSVKYNLDRGWLSNVILGKRKTIKGWSVTLSL
jgi:hypothetical protein